MNFKNLLLILFFFNTTALSSKNHQVSIIYQTPEDQQEQVIQKEIKASGIPQDMAHFINNKFKLPEPLIFKYGTLEGPSYNPNLNEIEIPYSFLQEAKELFKQEKEARQDINPKKAALDALLHTLLHELGHAIVNMYQLPVVGKEEDAVDDLATILLIEYFEEGQKASINAAHLFKLEDEELGNLEDEDFWSEHSLDIQRFYRIMCYVYGSDPQQFTWIKKDLGFPKERAVNCIEDYEISLSNWLSLLEEYIKD